MQENFPFIRDDVLPSWWANAIQRFLSVATFNLHIDGLTPTSLQVVAGSDENAAVLAIEGKWRWNETTVTRAHPGGPAGDYPIWATAADNVIVDVPDAGTDNTNYAWRLAITAAGDTPVLIDGVVDIVRQIGFCTWDGAKITAITQTVGQPQQGWSVGDIKPSLQTADHQGWKLADGRTNILRSTVPQGFIEEMLAAGFPGDSDLLIGVPDYRGRTLFGLGTHPDVDAFTDNEGASVGSRRAKHKHTTAESPHHHQTHYNYGLAGGVAGLPFYEENGHQFDTFVNTDDRVTGLTVGPQTLSPTDGPAFAVVNWFVYTGEVIGGVSTLGGGSTLLDAGDKIEWVVALESFAELWAEDTPAGYVPLHVDDFSASETFDGVNHVGPWRFSGYPSPVWTGSRLRILWHQGEGDYWREDWGPHNDTAQISAEFTFVGGLSTPTLPEHGQVAYVGFGNNVVSGEGSTWDRIVAIIFNPNTGQLSTRAGDSGTIVAVASTGPISGADMRVRLTLTRQGNNVQYECHDLVADSVIGSGTFAISGGELANYGAGVNLAAASWGGGAGSSFGSSTGSWTEVDNVTIYDVEQESRDIFVAITPSGGGERVQKRLFGVQGPTTVRSDFL